jgi:hypothetical protein
MSECVQIGQIYQFQIDYLPSASKVGKIKAGTCAEIIGIMIVRDRVAEVEIVVVNNDGTPAKNRYSRSIRVEHIYNKAQLLTPQWLPAGVKMIPAKVY